MPPSSSGRRLFRLLGDELPYGIAVTIDRWVDEEGGGASIIATLVVERDSHKGIVIGKGGAKLKEIGTQARRDIGRCSAVRCTWRPTCACVRAGTTTRRRCGASAMSEVATGRARTISPRRISDVRVDHQPAFVLHGYPWRETSLIVELLTRDAGRIAVVARGAKRPTSQFRGLLAPFCPLSVSWSGRGESGR